MGGKSRQIQNYNNDMGFDLDDVSDGGQKEEKPMDSYSKGQNLLKDHEEEASKGFRMKGPLGKAMKYGKSNNNAWENDDIEEVIEVEPIKEDPRSGLLDSGENQIAVS